MSKYTGDGRASEDLKFVLSVIDGPRLRNKETQPSGRFAGFQQSALGKAIVLKKRMASRGASSALVVLPKSLGKR